MLKGGTLLVVGDSTTYYNLINDGEDSSKLYCNQLAAWIRTNYGPVNIVHKGESGYSTTDITTVPNLRWITQSCSPDLVLVGAGVNDPYKTVAIGTTQTNIQTLINRLKLINPKVQIVLCTPSTIVTGNTVNGNQVDSSCTSIRSLYDTIASGYTNVYSCHFENGWTTSDSTHTYDKLHPNAAGHTVLAGLLQPVVQQNCAAWLSTLGH